MPGLTRAYRKGVGGTVDEAQAAAHQDEHSTNQPPIQIFQDTFDVHNVLLPYCAAGTGSAGEAPACWSGFSSGIQPRSLKNSSKAL